MSTSDSAMFVLSLFFFVSVPAMSVPVTVLLFDQCPCCVCNRKCFFLSISYFAPVTAILVSVTVIFKSSGDVQMVAWISSSILVQ